MPTLAFSSAGSTISISAAAPATFNAAGYGALTYTIIRDVTDIGMIGPESAVITHQPVNENTTYKVKGVRNNGQLSLKGARAPTDPGQMLLIAGEASNAPVSIKIVLQNGAVLYSQALVMSYKTSIGTSSQITGFESNVEISGDVINA